MELRLIRKQQRRTGVVVLHWCAFDQPHTLLDLAQRAGLSPFPFLRMFRKVTGVSPHQFLLRVRLNAAALELRGTNTPITEIAYATGFEDLSNFIRTFRAEFDLAPSRYRVR